MKKFWISLIFIFAGCVSQTKEYLWWQRTAVARPTHREILGSGHFEKTTAYGTLGDKTSFLAFFPIYLVEMANFIEQGGYMLGVVDPPQPAQERDKESEDVGEKMSDDADPGKRAIALEILDFQNHGEFAEKQGWQSLIDENDYVKMIGIHNLREKIAGLSFGQISLLLFDENEMVRLSVVKSLNGGKKSLPLLYRCLKDDSSFVRAEAIKRIAETGIPESVDSLWALLEDEEEYVRKQAIDALKKLTGKEVPYPFKGPKESHTQFVREWRRWWEKKKTGSER